MNTEKTLPIQWAKWDMAGDWGETMFYDVTFLEDWGPFKKYEGFKSLCVSTLTGLVEAFNSDGTEVVKKCEFKMEAVCP